LYGLFNRCNVGDGAVVWHTFKRRYGGELSTAAQYQLIVSLMTYKQGDTSIDAFVQEMERKGDIATSLSGAEVNDVDTKGVLFNNIKSTPGLLTVKALINATTGAYDRLAYSEVRGRDPPGG
jgi:hypothetical protein